MRIEPLSNVESAANDGATHRAIVKHTDLTETAAATAQAVTLTAVQAKMSVAVKRIELKQAFEATADAANNSTALTLGDVGSANRFVTSTELNKNGTEVFLSHGTGTTQLYTGAETVKATFTPGAGKTLAALDRGELWVYLRIVNAEFPNV